MCCGDVTWVIHGGYKLPACVGPMRLAMLMSRALGLAWGVKPR